VGFVYEHTMNEIRSPVLFLRGETRQCRMTEDSFWRGSSLFHYESDMNGSKLVDENFLRKRYSLCTYFCLITKYMCPVHTTNLES